MIDRPIVMGIINTTPDSFYAGSRVNFLDQALSTAEKMIKEGATILDIGGQSTRPKSQQLPPAEELGRVIPAVEAIHKNFPDQILSIDTFYSSVATGLRACSPKHSPALRRPRALARALPCSW